MPNQHSKKKETPIPLLSHELNLGSKTPESKAIAVSQPSYRDVTTEVTELTNSVAKTVQSFGQQGIKVDVEFSYPPARVKITISW